VIPARSSCCATPRAMMPSRSSSASIPSPSNHWRVQPTSRAARRGRAAWPPTPMDRSTSCSATTPPARCRALAPRHHRAPPPAPYNGFVVLADGSLVTKAFAAHARVTRSPPLRASAASSWCSSPSASGSSGARSSPSPRSPGCRLTTTRSTSSATRPCCGRTGTARTSSRRKASPALPHHGGADLRLGLRAGGGRRLVPRRRRGLGALLGDPSGPRGLVSPAPLVRTDLTTGAVTTAEICGLVGGLIANPPVIDEAARSPSASTPATG